MTTAARLVKCPICGKRAAYAPQNLYRPFCSERCKQIDLGAWAQESYRVPEQRPAGPVLPDEAG